MRLDKFLCEMNVGTRSQVKDYIRKGMVTVNEQIVKKPEEKIEPSTDVIAFQGERIAYQQYYYYMLNKPAGVVSATKDNMDKTVLELIATKRNDIFPVGRLDKDTEGLLLLTNDGALAHNMLSPKKHVDKTYLVTIKKELNADEIAALEQGVDIGDDKLTAPAKVEILDEAHMYLTIHEGRFHQVKRMLKAVNNEVLGLKRIRFGALFLDERLAPGEYRELTSQEVDKLHETKNDG
ncbi:MAG: rRNA pseudouridine synthase [Lachnospiraceae bacterium]|nr:rRNA pseudouridine synthase [Lachnospiraceae bacterium]